MSDLKLFAFQEEAAHKLRSAALAWALRCANDGPLVFGRTSIPFLGQLKAVTGAGKTPILAKVVGELGPAVVIWTSKSAAVVEQTYRNLQGKYRHLLPAAGVEILRSIPNHAAWRGLMTATDGLTIWVMTVASWNDVESASGSGSEDARLSLHRPQPDWAGSTSPWEQLRTSLKRPLWIVSDESHNQSDAQLDQLAALRPKGFFMASATPVQNALFHKWSSVIDESPEWKELANAGTVPVQTRDVVDAQLLKTTIEVVDYSSGAEESLDGVLSYVADLENAAKHESAGITPRAIYVVEESNSRRGSTELARPVAIWNYLRSKGVAADHIAVFTATRDLPLEAERIDSLSRLQSRHRHIIFNQSLQEGWDDPEAYVCYFDGVTKSFTRIRQIVGRVLRQPLAQHYATERLNTATLILNVPSAAYDSVIGDLKAELRLYGSSDDSSFAPIRVKTRKEPLPPIPVRQGLAQRLMLERFTLRAPLMAVVEAKIKSAGARPWSPDALDAPGLGSINIVSLESAEKERQEYINVARSARTRNVLYLRRRIQQANRNCLNALRPEVFKGPGLEQLSCQGSIAQSELADLASLIVQHYEQNVSYEPTPDPIKAEWMPADHRPRTNERIAFRNAAHPEYSKGDFNADELVVAQALDQFDDGIWVRNPSSPEIGYGIPLPAKVGDSLTFFPDFIWWIRGGCWGLDPTGRHLLDEKIRGKLQSLPSPRLALIVRGDIDLQAGVRSGGDGWTMVIARPNLKPLLIRKEEISELLKELAGKP
ncbi:hypothetical protein F0U62_17440 [Cystobacter fuscus]|uniref:DEAD/DEAH box helicase n=1 Tax=Cystobacter fuscus TaxID=43 RepID=UPI002B290F2F|nr:hypothetical protein F0U62_17440 [Cystobacter fuscus]